MGLESNGILHLVRYTVLIGLNNKILDLSYGREKNGKGYKPVSSTYRKLSEFINSFLCSKSTSVEGT